MVFFFLLHLSNINERANPGSRQNKVVFVCLIKPKCRLCYKLRGPSTSQISIIICLLFDLRYIIAVQAPTFVNGYKINVAIKLFWQQNSKWVYVLAQVDDIKSNLLQGTNRQ